MCLFKHHIKKDKVGSTHHEEIWGVRVYSSTLLPLAIDGHQWSPSWSSHFIPWRKSPGTLCTGGWLGHRAGLDILEKTEIFFPYWDWNTRSSSL